MVNAKIFSILDENALMLLGLSFVNTSPLFCILYFFLVKFFLVAIHGRILKAEPRKFSVFSFVSLYIFFFLVLFVNIV